MLLYKWLTEATQVRGNAKALVYRDTYLSWRGLSHRVERRAQEFASMGIGEGHYAGLMLGNVPDFAILALALSKVGATVVPLDPTTSARDLAMILDAAPFRALITRPRGGVDALPQTPVEKTRPGSRTPSVPESRRRLQGTLLTCAIYKKPKAPPTHPAEVVLFTSDSSGEPKGVLRSDANLAAGVQNLETTLELTPDDRILTTAPLFHAYGFDVGMCVALKLGATLFLEDEVSPARIVKILRDQEVNFLPGLPSLYSQLSRVPTAKPLKTKHARFLSAGSPLADSVAEAFRERWGVRVLSMYHTTEANAVAVDRKGGSQGSVGRAVDGVELRVGDAGKHQASGAGAVWVRSAAVSKVAIGTNVPGPHPFDPPEVGRKKAKALAAGGVATPAVVPIGAFDGDGWFRTGDLGKLDKLGKLSLTGREDDVVKVDGKRVALGEVEGCIETISKVKAAQALLIEDPLAGPMVVARVVVNGKVGAEEIIDHCARNLASYKVPRRIEFCAALG